MPLQATSGAASYDAFGGGVPVSVNYIEDVFSTYLYTGNATTGQSINNGIDLATKGGLLWCKNRTTGSTPHYLFDTARDFSYSHATVLNTASTAAQEDKGTDYAKPETNGFSFGSGAGSTSPNKSGDAFASWTFRKQPKFFDIQTWTGDGTESRVISHNLGSAPGCIIIKRTDTTSNWFTFHRSATENLYLNSTTAGVGGLFFIASSASATFTLGTNTTSNASGGTYVAYLFAHDAGGFGLTGTDNVISCGSFTTDGSGNATVDLGYEPQWVLVKNTSSNVTGGWNMIDNMRGWTTINGAALFANATDAEFTSSLPELTSTGFNWTFNNAAFASTDYIYIAIRRGPMKVPTSGTSVFNPDYAWNTNPNILGYLGQPTDAFWLGYLSGNAVSVNTRTRLVGGNRLTTSSTSAEVVDATTTYWSSQLGFQTGGSLTTSLITWNFRRAPGFFDVVCYLGTGSATTVAHNLGAVPELMIVKERNGANGWQVYSASLTNTDYLILNTSAAVPSPSTTRWNSTTPTSTVFSVGTHGATNGSGQNFVAYLFATCAGVSKVGSYTGTGTTKQIDCGFTGGARFVLIKRTDSTGSWYVWDSSRGIVSGNDPYLLLNSTAAEVTNTDYIDTYSAGFEISSTAPTEINASGGSFIFLAVA